MDSMSVDTCAVATDGHGIAAYAQRRKRVLTLCPLQSGVSPGDKANSYQSAAPGAAVDAELARVIDAWSSLTSEQMDAILRIVECRDGG